jgi:hypothetical protein
LHNSASQSEKAPKSGSVSSYPSVLEFIFLPSLRIILLSVKAAIF